MLVAKYLSCFYPHSGNVRGEQVYKVGPACSGCPEGTCCGGSCRRYGVTPAHSGLCTVVGDGPGVLLDDEDKLVLNCLFNKVTSPWCPYRSDPNGGWTTKTFFA
ncbi:hypothetical protein MRX96_054051, partial [Rhipicephalus microplus]